MAGRVDYGLDAPGVVAWLGVGGIANLLGAWAMVVWLPGGWWRLLAGLALLGGVVQLAESLLMIRSSRIGKVRLRDRVLDALALRGDERALDVGCGRGLLLLGAARRLPRGHAVGIDRWSQRDQRANHRAATLANAVAEGVAERVEVVDGDMRRLPFGDAGFDVVVSSLAIHNLPSRAERRTAIDEIVRVLAPGGRVALIDFQRTGDYVADLAAGGLVDASRSARCFGTFPPTRVVTARKPA